MAIAFTNIDSGTDDSNGTVYTVTPGSPLVANQVACFDVQALEAGGFAAAPSDFADSLGNVWTKEGEYVSATNALVRYVAPIAVPGVPTFTITYPIGCEGIIWSLNSSADIDFLDPIVQTRVDSKATGTSLDVALFPPEAATSGFLAVIGRQAAEATSPGTSTFTELSDDFIALNPPTGGPRGMQVQWKLNDATVDWTWTTSGSSRSIVTEFRFGVSAPIVVLPAMGPLVSMFTPVVANVSGAGSDPAAAQGGTCGGGGMNAMTVSPFNDQRVVTWGDLAGPYYSENGGETYERCAGGIADDSPPNTGGALMWGQDPNFPNRVWALTSAGAMVSNSWPPRWSMISSGVQGGEHGTRPRVVGGMIHDTGNGIVYWCSPTAIRRYNVPAGASGIDSGGFTVIANSGFAGANGICSDPQDDSRVWFATSTGVRQVDNADTRTTPASTQVAGLTGQTWDVSATARTGTTYLFVASATNKVRRYTQSSGTVLTVSSLPGGNYCAIDSKLVNGNIECVVNCTNSVALSGNFQQYFRSTDAHVGNPSWTCVSLDNADMDVLETEGPNGEDWIGYLRAAEGGSFGNKVRDDGEHTAHDMALSENGRYLYVGSTGGNYRFDFQLKRVYPMMHNLGAMTFGAIRAHPTEPLKAIAMNTDHGALVTENGGIRWKKDETGAAPQGVTQGTAACWDIGSTTRAFASFGNRNANTGGVVCVNDDPFTVDGWVSLGWGLNVQCIGMDARRVGSTQYMFAAGLNHGMRRWSAPVGNQTNAGGTWINCAGTCFTSGGSALNADIRWASDSVVWALDRSRGVYRCTNPTAANPTFSLVLAFTQDAQREGFMRVVSTTQVVLSGNGILRRVNSDGSVVNVNKAGGAPFVRAGVMDVASDGTIYATESKPRTDNPADAALYRGPGNTLSDNITDAWFAANHVKQSDMSISADDSRLYICGRGGGCWHVDLEATDVPEPPAQSFELPHLNTVIAGPPPISLGMWPQSFVQFQAIETALGTPIPYFRGRQLDGQWDSLLIQSHARAAVNAGYSIGMNIQPKTGTGGNRTGVLYTSIIPHLQAGSGQHYDKIISFINECKTLPEQGERPYYMQFHSEAAFQAAPGVPDAQPFVGNATDFKTCHDLVYQLFLDEGVDWLTWQVVQNHGVYEGNNGGTAAWIPPRYDLVGVDDYHGLSNGRYETPQQMFGTALAFAQSRGKKLWIDETGSNEGGPSGTDANDKAAWYQALDLWLQQNQDDMAGIVFSHAQDGGNWYVDSVLSGGRASPNFTGITWNAWRTMGRSQKFQATPEVSVSTVIHPLTVALGGTPPPLQNTSTFQRLQGTQVLPLDVAAGELLDTGVLEYLEGTVVHDMTLANDGVTVAGRVIGYVERHEEVIGYVTRS